MNTYYALVMNDGKRSWQERKGRRVKNNHGLELFAEHRGRNNWTITEARSGLRVSEGSLRKRAVEQFEEYLRKHKLSFIQKRIEEIVKLHGENPLYTDEPKLPVIPLEREEQG